MFVVAPDTTKELPRLTLSDKRICGRGLTRCGLSVSTASSMRTRWHGALSSCRISHSSTSSSCARSSARAASVAGAGGNLSTSYAGMRMRSEEHTSELQSRQYLVCRLLLEKKKNQTNLSDTVFYFTKNT